jgi:Histidine kinase-, DNA gyrase B-, and HSP90-like ATPase
MRFKPDERLIDLMVGQLFYKSPEVAMRELLQNAEDACSLQRIKDVGFEPFILVRYSVNENWVEVIDNGLGMNREAIENSFAAIGASKENVSHIKELLARAVGDVGRQIAFFGVGILSCFGVAQSLAVKTKMDGQEGLSFDIIDHHQDFQDRADLPSERGTTLRLQLKINGPMRADQVSEAVARYARHAGYVQIENADSNERHPAREQWISNTLPGAIAIDDPGIRAGFLALQPGWNQAGSTLQSELLVCNGGFLVREREVNLLSPQAIGYTGEIDVKPNELTIQLNREGFVTDQKWQEMGRRLTATYNRLIRSKLDEWDQIAANEPEKVVGLGIEQGVIVLTRGPTRGILEPDINERLDRMLPSVVSVKVRGGQTPLPLTTLLARATESRVIYYTREDVGPRQFQQSVQQAGGNVQVTEVAQTEALRATHLQAKGALVLSCRPRNYTIMVGEANQNVSVHEADLLGQECQKLGIRFVEVNAATPEEVALTGAAESDLVSELLGLGEKLKLVPLDGFQDRVLRDYAGRLLNCRNPEIREILRFIPDAIGNPVRRVLLQIYMDLDSYRLEEARQKTRQLLTMADLADQAQLSTGDLLRSFLEDKLRPLVDPAEKPQ